MPVLIGSSSTREMDTEHEDSYDEGDGSPVSARSNTSKARKTKFVETPRLRDAAQGDEHLAAHKRIREKDAEARELIITGIKQNKFCKGLGEDDVEEICETMEHFVFEAGETIVTQGHRGRYFFVTHEGTLDVSINAQAANTLVRGSAFGAIALLYNCPRTATVVARDACALWGADGENFRKVLKRHAEEHMAERLHVLDCFSLFNGLSTRQKERIGKSALFVMYFDAGARVIMGGEVGHAMYFVKSGELSAMKGCSIDANGGTTCGVKIAQLNVGDTFGETAVMYGEPYKDTVVASVSCELFCITTKELKEVVGDDLVAALEQTLALSVLKMVPGMSHLSPSQLQHVLQAMVGKRYGAKESIADGLRLVIVLKGEITGRSSGATVTLQRGQWWHDDDMVQLAVVGGEPSNDTRAACPLLSGLVAGPSGCRTAVLTRSGFESAMRQCGLVSVGGSCENGLDYMRKVLLSRKVRIFRDLSEEQIGGLVNSLVLNRYSPGARVFTQGEVGSAFFVVATGEVRILIDDAYVGTLGKYACFGERSLLLSERRSATVEVASCGAELWSIDRKNFKDIVVASMRAELAHRIHLHDTVSRLKDLAHVRLIGAGAFGSVRLVEHKRTAQRYALKRVRKVDGKVPSAVRQECELLGQVDHPMILRLVKVFETAGNAYLLTELITGGQLYEQTNHRMGTLSRKQAQFYIGCLVLILEAIHEHLIVYRDLKPENVMLDEQGYLKLVDFGLAKKLDGTAARTYTLAGTLLYMAPEAITGLGYGMEVDIWALGVMLFELVCGCLPFGDGLEDSAGILVAIIEDNVVFPGKYNDSAGKKLIQRLLDKVPERRLGSGLNGYEDIKEHKFFKVGVSGNLFNMIIGHEIEAPVIPEPEQYSDERHLSNLSLSDADELGVVEPSDARNVIQSTFEMFDVNKDGKISRCELAKVLQKLNPETFTDPMIDSLLDAADADKDGFVQFNEFFDWVFSKSSGSVLQHLDVHV